MKPFLAIILSVALLLSAGITLAGPEDICGTWINTEYMHPPHQRKAQKRIFNPDRTVTTYRYESSQSPIFEGTYTITEQWTDSEENTCYKVKATGKLAGQTAVWYLLCRIGDSGKSLEIMYHPVDYHKKLDPTHPSYRVYQRK